MLYARQAQKLFRSDPIYTWVPKLGDPHAQRVAHPFALARSLTRPILALQEGAARFGRGDLNVRLDEVSKDELGQLAAEFNRMAEALAEQQTHLRRRAEQFFNLSPDLLCTLNPTGLCRI